VRQLRKQEGGDIVVLGSGSVIRNLLEAGEGVDFPGPRS
jgi:dihydrofolate reductase